MAPSVALIALANTFLSHFCSLDMDQMLSIRTSDCVQVIGPASMDRPAMDNAAFRSAYGSVLRHFRSMSMETKSILTDTERNVVVLHVQSRATTIGPRYDMEYIFILHATADAKALNRIEEFIDSATAKTQWTQLQEAIVALEEMKHVPNAQ
ncbi:hypothetical protein BDV95DRAFT_486549 [Massariosphaeria phaeospora]|uniref:SnoaL-like domain-containing protein n=1 Tax=Massariosphaeria phaeospora TaxID=100035 RepID=A0A7C8IBA5_9PLEO|nr:hypothetical protein BDV95DRAFT_486549 [Massariosphaeria phaeospora]